MFPVSYILCSARNIHQLPNDTQGVALPFGQVKLAIDTSVLNLDQGGISSANSGYTPRGNATGFSLLHTSGTGGRESEIQHKKQVLKLDLCVEPKYGVVSQMPLVGSLQDQGINVADNRTYLTNRTNEVIAEAPAKPVLR
jgi:putative alpha-1,2-mannosidase